MASTAHNDSRVKPEHYVYSHITKIPGVCGGNATIDGRRVRVMDIVVLLQQGETPEQTREAYPFLSLAQIHAASSSTVIFFTPCSVTGQSKGPVR